MAFFFGDGFDLYAQLADAATYWDASLGSVTLSLSAAGRFAGSRGVTFGPISSSVPYLTKTSAANDAVHHFSIAFQQVSALSGTLAGIAVTLYDGASVQCSVAFRQDGAIILTTTAGGGGTTLATYTGAVAAINTWYQFEIEVVIHNTAGSIAVRKLGNTVNDFFLGSLNTRNGSTNAYANKIGFGMGSFTPAQVADDFLWRSDASSLAWLGDIRCYTRLPASDAGVQFTRSGAVVPVTPFVQGSTATPSITSPRYSPFVATCDGTIGSAVLSIAVGFTGNVKCALFANAAGAPGAILGSANVLANPVTGPNTITFGTPVAVTRGTTYWIGFVPDTAVTNSWNYTVSIGAAAYNNSAVTSTTTYAAFPVASPAIVTTGLTAVVFTAVITPTTISNAEFVSENAGDYVGAYVLSSTVGQSDLYNLGALGATPGAIVGVTTRAYLQKSDAGTRIAAVQLQSGAANVQGSLVLNTTWAWAYRNDFVDPATSAAWTATGVNNAQIGVTVTT